MSAPGTPGIRRVWLAWWISKHLAWLFALLWFRLRVEGRERLPRSGPVLLVCNHASFLDPPLLGSPLPRWVAYVARNTLGAFRPFGWWMRAMGTVLIDRSAPSKEQMRQLADHLAAGHVVGLFPEGTRSRDGSVGPFRSGLEMLVRRSGAVVVPAGLEGVHRAMPRGAVLPRPRKIVLRLGEPWSADAVLAPGGLEGLRAAVAALARAPLADASLSPEPQSGTGPEPIRADPTDSAARRS